MTLASKLPSLGTTIFTVMTHLANEYQAINLAQGFPGFKCDTLLTDLAAKYMHDGYNQYAPMQGISALRQRVSDIAKEIHHTYYAPDTEVTIVSGATEALYVAITAVVKPGDEVIIIEPAYDSYAPAVILNGGIPIYVSLNEVSFDVNWSALEEKINNKTTLIIVNTPHNPTGKVWSEKDVNTLANLIENKDIYVVSDEVYEHIVFDGLPHYSLMRNATLREKSFICSSFGKAFHVTGWKIGYCLAPSSMTVEFRKLHQYFTFSTATPLQYAIAEYMEEPSRYLELAAFYQKKRDLFCEGLRASTPFTFIPTEGSFFQTVNYQHLSDVSDYDLAVRMIKEIGVASIPNSSFYHLKEDYKILRFCFAKDDEVLLEAIYRLGKFNI